MAYDVTVLVGKLKKRGGDALKGAVSDVSGWLQDSIKESVTPYDDLLLPIVPQVEVWVNAKLDSLLNPPVVIPPVTPVTP